jgi:hypothetical protein
VWVSRRSHEKPSIYKITCGMRSPSSNSFPYPTTTHQKQTMPNLAVRDAEMAVPNGSLSRAKHRCRGCTRSLWHRDFSKPSREISRKDDGRNASDRSFIGERDQLKPVDGPLSASPLGPHGCHAWVLPQQDPSLCKARPKPQWLFSGAIHS